MNYLPFDADNAFQNAINRGLLTVISACDYMYMYSKLNANDEIVDYFKHVETREYQTVTRIND